MNGQWEASSRPGSVNCYDARACPEPVSQYEVYDGDEFIARVDFAYPGFGVVIEVDGEERHTGRSPRKHDVQPGPSPHLRWGFHPLRFYWDEVHRTTRRPSPATSATAIRRPA